MSLAKILLTLASLSFMGFCAVIGLTVFMVHFNLGAMHLGAFAGTGLFTWLLIRGLRAPKRT